MFLSDNLNLFEMSEKKFSFFFLLNHIKTKNFMIRTVDFQRYELQFISPTVGSS